MACRMVVILDCDDLFPEIPPSPAGGISIKTRRDSRVTGGQHYLARGKQIRDLRGQRKAEHEMTL